MPGFASWLGSNRTSKAQKVQVLGNGRSRPVGLPGVFPARVRMTLVSLL